MDKRLAAQAAKKYFGGLLVLALLVFLPAGTLRFWNGWLLIGLLFGPMLIVGAALLLRRPDLLRKRLEARESEPEQKKVLAWSAAMFLAAFVAAGLDCRFGWTRLPVWAVWTAAAVFLLGYGLYAEVLRENAYLSRTVEVQEGQKVVDTGLYGVVRHPMYAATVLLFLAMPLVLGSLIAFVIMLGYIPIIAARIRDEERVLTEGLPGYAQYRERVRYRLIPFIW